MSDQTVKYTLTLTDLLTGKLDAADRSAKKLETTMGGLQRTANMVGAAVGIAFGLDQLRALGAGIVQAGTKVEDARVGLTTLLRDSAEAGQVIKNTMEDATKTPFAFEGLLSANKALISANATAGEARETVLNLANAIAATGGGDNELQRMVVNLQQIRNTGKATALDIKQFAYAGINVYQLLANATGRPIEKVKDLEVSYDLLRFALKKAHDEGGLYANGLENMAGNTSVRISNLGDAMFQLKVKIFDDLKPAIEDLLAVGMDMIKWLGDAWEWTKRNKDAIFALAKGVVVGVIAFKAYKVALQAGILWTKIQYASITLLGDGFLRTNAMTKLFAGSWQMLTTAIRTNPVGLAVTAIAGLAAAYFAFSKDADLAANSNDKLNKSLYETQLLALQTEENFIKDLEKMYDGMGLKGKERMAKVRQDIDQEGIRILGLIRSNQEEMDKMGVGKGFVMDADKAKRLELENRGLYQSLQSLNAYKEGGYKRIGAPKKIGGGDNFDLTSVKTKEAKGATGNRSVNIKIEIGALIKDLKITTTTINQSVDKVKEMVTQALLSAVNDSQIVAGQ
jgi:tape measure domain-containing protein